MEQRGIYVTGLAPAAEAELLTSLRDLRLARVDEAPARGEDAARTPLAVVGLNGNADGAFATVARLAASGARVAVVGPAKDPDLILRSMRAGAREYAVAGDAARLQQAVRSLARPDGAVAAGQVLAIFPAKGGMGATTLAANVAADLVRGGDRTCLVDLDLQLGDVNAFLDVHGGYTITDVVANMRRLDRDLLDASVQAHRSGVHVLAQEERLEEAEHLDAAAVEKLIGFLRQHYQHLVLDGLRGFDERSLAALDAADRVVLVVTQEVPAVRNAQRCVELFRKLGYSDAKLAIVVNRCLRASNITPEVIAETLGVPVTATVANDFVSASRAVQRGSTVMEEAPRSALARDVSALARKLSGADQDRRRPGMLRRMFARR
ncbi:AAA family ATPase [Anaeromyxobacter dehalogenans]|uniref:Flp pilus assembly protein ATPase CpaE-like protein n=1 Tax=Anaeromyxobacter dehalogenans (strain 2CP-C) TaxID=290397 RepID=Q2ILR3_ANADE|nr:AAA family ATPase [Anaeromyxobacter dehalogenans]ABC82596.1 Flp pilus assembly protein ATPase CpaE-like protein [Anaeromyxobacter dehalogenans 2CP-C]